MSFTDAHMLIQLRATQALLKFCEDHRYPSERLAKLRQCLEYLDSGCIEKAFDRYEAIPLGGKRCFNDWLPPVVFDHEDAEYVWAVFEALCDHWSRMMKLAWKG